MAKSEFLKVKVIATALPKGYEGTEGDELMLPNKEAHSLEKRGYVTIDWSGVEIQDMTTNKDAETVTGLPAAKKYKKPEKKAKKK